MIIFSILCAIILFFASREAILFYSWLKHIRKHQEARQAGASAKNRTAAGRME
jgi:hypothetical protein